jgi:OFA family oxalate/formate antiporter-like MFS transporter
MEQSFESFEKNKIKYYIAALAVCFIVGLGYTWSVVQTPFITHLHAEDKLATVALCYTVTVLCSTMSPTLLGHFTRKLSVRQMIVIGGILFGGGYIGCGFITNLPMLFLFYALGTGIGTGLCYPTMMGYAASVMPERQGLASGLMAGIYGGSAMIWNPILAGMLENNYTFTFNMIGVICLVVLIVCGLILRPVPEGYVDYKKKQTAGKAGAASAQKSRPVRHVQDKNRGEMVRTGMFYVAAVAFAFGLTSGMMVLSQVSPMMQASYGVTVAAAAGYASLMSLMSMLGRILWGTVTDKTDKYVTLCIICAIPVITMGILAARPGMTVAIVCMALTILSYGGFGGTITPITADLFGSKYITENYGVMYLMFGIAGLIGPRLAVSLKNGGDYSKAFMVACILACISLIAAILVRRKVKATEETA